MATRRLLPLLALLFGLLVVGPAQTQEPPAKPSQKAQPPDAAGLERRLAALEAQVSKLVKEVQELRNERKASTLPKGEFKVFPLKHAKAAEIAKTLQELLQEKDGRSLRIVGDPSSNSVLVQGSREQLEVVEAIIARLEEASQQRGAK